MPQTPQVEQLVQELGPEDLLPCLRQGVWDRAFEILDGMVRNGEAIARAIEAQGLDPLNIERAHPELVILLRCQAYWDLKGREGDAKADFYFHQHIDLLYPHGESTGSPFVDKLLASLRVMRGDKKLTHEETYLSVMDYLKIYFPQFRHHVEEGSTRVGGLFGERTGRTVRCLACHKEFRGYTPAKLRSHLLHDVAGKQAKCQASTIYIREEIQAAEEAAAAALHPAPAIEAAAHPGPDGQGDVPDDGTAGPRTPPPHPLPPDAVTEDGAVPTTTSTPPGALLPEDGSTTEIAPAVPPVPDDE